MCKCSTLILFTKKLTFIHTAYTQYKHSTISMFVITQFTVKSGINSTCNILNRIWLHLMLSSLIWLHLMLPATTNSIRQYRCRRTTCPPGPAVPSDQIPSYYTGTKLCKYTVRTVMLSLTQSASWKSHYPPLNQQRSYLPTLQVDCHNFPHFRPH